MAFEIALATPDDVDAVRELFREYAAHVDAPACFANFEEELAGLPGAYAAPGGAILLAKSGSELAGCVALQGIGDARGEMKRLYVRGVYRGAGLGRSLTERAIDFARGVGYAALVLDTLPKMREAIALYRSLGFRETGSYSTDPTPGAIFFELELRGQVLH